MKTYLEPEEIDKLEDAATNTRDKLLIRVLFHVACRVSETLAIEPGNIDFTEGTITIPHLKSRIKLACPQCGAGLGRSHEFCPKCGSRVKEAVAKELEHRKFRSPPADSDTLNMLQDFIRRGGPVSKGGRTLVFGINRHRAWQIVKQCADRAGLPKLVNPETGRERGVSPHRLRDAFAVHAVKLDDSGDGFRLLQEHLGHASFNTTAKYPKVAGSEHRAWYDKLWKRQVKPDGA